MLLAQSSNFEYVILYVYFIICMAAEAYFFDQFSLPVVSVNIIYEHLISVNNKA